MSQPASPAQLPAASSGGVRPSVWFIFAVTVTGILSNSMLTPNIPDVLIDFDQPSGRAGLLVGAGSAPAVLLAPVIGILADRHGRKKVLLPCLVIFGCGALLGSLAPGYWTLVAARLFQGVGGAGLINMAIVLIGDHWTGPERTRLIGRNSAVLTTALALFPLASGLLAELAGWRASVAVGGIAIPVAVIGWRVMPDVSIGSGGPDGSVTVIEQLKGTGRALRNPQLIFVMLTGFLLFLVIFGVFLTALPVHLEEKFGLGPGARGLILSLPAIGATVAAFNLDVIRSWIRLRWLLVGCAMFISIAAFGLAIAPVVALAVVAVILYGFGDGALIPALQDVTTSITTDDQRASVMAAWVAAVRAGQTAGPISVGLIIGWSSTSVAMMAGAIVFAVVSVLYLVGPIDDTTTDPVS